MVLHVVAARVAALFRGVIEPIWEWID